MEHKRGNPKAHPATHTRTTPGHCPPNTKKFYGAQKDDVKPPLQRRMRWGGGLWGGGGASSLRQNKLRTGLPKELRFPLSDTSGTSAQKRSRRHAYSPTGQWVCAQGDRCLTRPRARRPSHPRFGGGAEGVRGTTGGAQGLKASR